MSTLQAGMISVNKSLKIGGPVPGLGRVESSFKMKRGYQAVSMILGVVTDEEAEKPLADRAKKMLNALGWIEPDKVDNAALVTAALDLVHALCPTCQVIPREYHAREQLLALRKALGLDGHNAEANPS